MSGRRPFPTVWLLAGLGALSFFIQYSTMEKFAVFAPGSSHIRPGTFLEAVDQQITFSVLDGVLAGLFLLSAAALFYGEARRRALTGFLQDCFASPRRTFWLLMASLLVCGRFYLARGELSWGGDASHHLAHSWLAARAIADGQVPIWTFFIGTGSPVFQTYGFAFFCSTRSCPGPSTGSRRSSIPRAGCGRPCSAGRAWPCSPSPTPGTGPSP